MVHFDIGKNWQVLCVSHTLFYESGITIFECHFSGALYNKGEFKECTVPFSIANVKDGVTPKAAAKHKLLFSKLAADTFANVNEPLLRSMVRSGNTKGGRITVPLTSCLTGLVSAVRILTINVSICKTD